VNDLLQEAIDMLADAQSGYIPGCGEDQRWIRDRDRSVAKLRALSPPSQGPEAKCPRCNGTRKYVCLDVECINDDHADMTCPDCTPSAKAVPKSVAKRIAAQKGEPYPFDSAKAGACKSIQGPEDKCGTCGEHANEHGAINHEYTKGGGPSFEGSTEADVRADQATGETGNDRPAAPISAKAGAVSATSSLQDLCDAKVDPPDLCTLDLQAILRDPRPRGLTFGERNSLAIILRERLRSTPAPDAWQPIETAPKEKAILCWWGDCHPPLDDRLYAVAVCDEDECWMDRETGEEFCSPPTHWMLLPDPPVRK
jgi:hypothetical protein